jgi:hypothetical protein
MKKLGSGLVVPAVALGDLAIAERPPPGPDLLTITPAQGGQERRMEQVL